MQLTFDVINTNTSTCGSTNTSPSTNTITANKILTFD